MLKEGRKRQESRDSDKHHVAKRAGLVSVRRLQMSIMVSYKSQKPRLS